MAFTSVESCMSVDTKEQTPDLGHIPDNIRRIRNEIADAAHQAGRSPDDVSLMAVTKTRTAAEIDAAIAAGLTLLGENRVQEAAEKMPDVTQPAEWHMIGHLQSNKVKQALELFTTIQSVDSLRLAQRISRLASEQSQTVDVLVEVNTSGEESKFGAPPESAVELVGAIRELPSLRLTGMMTIGLFSDDERCVRACFEMLRRLRDDAASLYPDIRLSALSMGMTSDYRWAIAEGSTLVRIGTAIFGPRVYAA